MTHRRIVIFGNAGSGKTTMARALGEKHDLAHLDLDAIAWAKAGVRRPLTDSILALHSFRKTHASWVIEGSYGQLVETLLPACTELRFLHPGTQTCVENCYRRPFEPEKYDSPDAQNARLDGLIEWVRRYETRDDEYGLAFHQALFDRFSGPKRTYTTSGSDAS
jgi:adenylate kinase family enzyme